jgi:hypothetical protein
MTLGRSKMAPPATTFASQAESDLAGNLAGRAGKGICYNGKVVAHAPIEAVTSHEQLAIRSGTLLEAPLPGTRGFLVEGAEAFTYTTDASRVFVTGSMNFSMNVSENAVQTVTFFVKGLK